MGVFTSGEEESSIDTYLREIGQYDILDLDTEVELARQFHEGDEEAGKKLIMANLRFPYSRARQFHFWTQLPVGDLIGAGNYGLLRALPGYNPSSPETRVKFVVYAERWVHGEQMSCVREMVNLVHFPRAVLSSWLRTQRKKFDFENEGWPGEVATDMALGQTRMERSAYEEVNRFVDLVRLDAPVEEARSFHETLSQAFLQSSESSLIGCMFDERLKAIVQGAIGHLKDSYQKLIYNRFWRDLTLREIGDAENRSYEAVRQMEERALEKLRRGPYSQDLRTLYSDLR